MSAVALIALQPLSRYIVSTFEGAEVRGHPELGLRVSLAMYVCIYVILE